MMFISKVNDVRPIHLLSDICKLSIRTITCYLTCDFSKKKTNIDIVFSGSDHTRVNVFFAILDSLKLNLQKRCNAYTTVNDRFGFLMQLPNLCDEEILSKFKHRVAF